MRNIADQLLVLHIILQFFFGRIPQPLPHLFKIQAELADLVLLRDIQLKVQISVLDLPCGLLQLAERF